MFKGLGDMSKLMKQAQEMQQKMADAQARLEEIEAEGSAGAGMVRAVVSAKGLLKRVSIDPSIFSAEDREVVEDLIVAAVQDAQEKGQEKAQAEMASVTEGMPLPPGMKLPF
ncbi:YbaB/EbfC family nucleoid-associated protein [Paroceanicella profunda]|uniref:Nucleoid-associated protein FDP22_12085 n=1 Tax=Paroceanicella profunda TaxID=2579971 RepID=A0A5B8G1R0_9RHOB|nr:YbaB/EbfC family nucleoid-associated protein [Paroceanicella profunda]QDL92453.1 YbaB/EbfC family nucleoid-associated protein [Paroceanicella profunda]